MTAVCHLAPEKASCDAGETDSAQDFRRELIYLGGEVISTARNLIVTFRSAANTSPTGHYYGKKNLKAARNVSLDKSWLIERARALTGLSFEAHLQGTALFVRRDTS